MLKHSPLIALSLSLTPTPEAIVAAFATCGVILDEVQTDLSITGRVVVESGTLPEWLLTLAAVNHEEIRAYLTANAGGIRCPKCNKRLGDELVGVYRTTCPRCKTPVTITR